MEKSINNSVNQSISNIKKLIQADGKGWIYNSEVEHNSEFVHIFFVGLLRGKEVLFDTTICTLYLHYASLLFEMADEQLQQQNPDYAGWDSLEGNNTQLDEQRAELIAELEASGQIKVQEQVEVTEESEEVVVLDVYLNAPQITSEMISRFVPSYKSGKLKLDHTLYSFSLEEEI
ncbi:MAG: hypothetical protein ACFB0B_20610 [Thermonemataceae bacterium]